MGSAFPVNSESTGEAARYRLWILSRTTEMTRLSLREEGRRGAQGLVCHRARRPCRTAPERADSEREVLGSLRPWLR